MPTHYEGTNEEVQALDAYIKLVRAAESVTARLMRRLSRHRLTVSQFGVLEALLHLGPLSQVEIGRKLLKSSGNVTMVVDNLEKRSLVRRCRQEGDRRCVSVSLTDEGTRLIQEIFPGHVEAVVQEMQALGEPEQRELGRLCKRLGKP
jgi:MarR family transcriptional regulator, 2-MHQ and catechol-resistance regulon repressor